MHLHQPRLEGEDRGLLAGVAAWRTGRASKAILVPSLLFLLTAFLPEGTVTSYVPFVVGGVLGGWLAQGVLVRR